MSSGKAWLVIWLVSNEKWLLSASLWTYICTSNENGMVSLVLFRIAANIEVAWLFMPVWLFGFRSKEPSHR